MKKFLWWEASYTVDEIKELLAEIKNFNAGAIDDYLSKHVDKVFAEWLKSK